MISKQKPFGASFLALLFYYLHLTAITNFLGLTDSWMMRWPFAIVFPRMEAMGVGCDDIAARYWDIFVITLSCSIYWNAEYFIRVESCLLHHEGMLLRILLSWLFLFLRYSGHIPRSICWKMEVWCCQSETVSLDWCNDFNLPSDSFPTELKMESHFRPFPNG